MTGKNNNNKNKMYRRRRNFLNNTPRHLPHPHPSSRGEVTPISSNVSNQFNNNTSLTDTNNNTSLHNNDNNKIDPRKASFIKLNQKYDNNNDDKLDYLPANVCIQQHLATQASFSINKLSLLLNYVASGSIVIFDIDDTLIRKKYFGTSLLSTEGIKQFQLYMSKNLTNCTFNVKQTLVNGLHSHLKDSVCTEEDTSYIIKTLQDRGVYVFGLTARANTMSVTTQNTLKSLNIDLTLSCPNSLPRKAVDSQTGAVINDGIVYCNEVDKGIVLQRLLQQNWINFDHIFNNNRYHEAHDNHAYCPERVIWFIDDSIQMIQGMINQWNQMIENQKKSLEQMKNWGNHMPCQGKFSLICCHYIHPTSVSYNTFVQNQNYVLSQYAYDILLYQIRQFVYHHKIVSDQDSLAYIQECLANNIEPNTEDISNLRINYT